MGFQTQVNQFPAPGIPGVQASANPVATVDAGEGALVAAPGGVTVANFGWITGTSNLGGGVVSNSTSTPVAPDGLVLNSHEALITEWLGQSSLVIPQGLGCTLAQRGDFWAVSNSAPAVRGQKVFANLFNGAVLVAAAGSTPVTNVGTAAAFAISDITAGLMAVSAVTSGVLAVGQLVSGLGIPANTYIQNFVSGSGSTGTYQLTQTTLNSYAVASATSVSPEGNGGFSGTATFDTNQMTVDSTVYGTLAVGQIVVSAGVTAGTHITGVAAPGVYTLSTAPGTITPAQAVTASSWIETPWYALSDGNPGDLVKIGVKN